MGKRSRGSNGRVFVPSQRHGPGGSGESRTGRTFSASPGDVTATIGCEKVRLRWGARGTSPSGARRSTRSGPASAGSGGGAVTGGGKASFTVRPVRGGGKDFSRSANSTASPASTVKGGRRARTVGVSRASRRVLEGAAVRAAGASSVPSLSRNPGPVVSAAVRAVFAGAPGGAGRPTSAEPAPRDETRTPRIRVPDRVILRSREEPARQAMRPPVRKQRPGRPPPRVRSGGALIPAATAALISFVRVPPSRTILLQLLALAFLLGNLALRTLTLHAAGGPWVLAFMVVALLAAGISWFRPALLGITLFLFGASFFLYGFHSYRVQSQLFEYAVTALALSLLLRGFAAGKRAENWPARFWLLYLLLALFSLLLLPATVLRHRLMLAGIGPFGDILAAFPRDPLYPLAGLNRLALFVLFAVLLARREDARDRYRALFRGIAWGSVASVLLGLLDFFGLISLTPYNLSRLFYGAGYQRLQSTFGNPTWFASFVTCTLPFIVF